MPLSPGHLPVGIWYVSLLFNSSLVITDSLDLVPDNPYPRQMTQATLALKYLLKRGYSPSDVSPGPSR